MTTPEECAPAHSRIQPAWVAELLKLAKATFKAPSASLKEKIAKNFADKETSCYQHVPIAALKSLNHEEYGLKHVLCKPKLYFSQRVGVMSPTVLGVGMV